MKIKLVIILIVLLLSACDYNIDKGVSYCADKGGMREMTGIMGKIYVTCHNGNFREVTK